MRGSDPAPPGGQKGSRHFPAARPCSLDCPLGLGSFSEMAHGLLPVLAALQDPLQVLAALGSFLSCLPDDHGQEHLADPVAVEVELDGDARVPGGAARVDCLQSG